MLRRDERRWEPTEDCVYWVGSAQALRAMMQTMRLRSEGATTEEKVMLDEMDRMAGALESTLRARMRAMRLGAKPCSECMGDPLSVNDADLGASLPGLRCQVCGWSMTPAALGITDAFLPKGRFEQVEAALVKAWNARYDASMRKEAAARLETGPEGDEIL